MPYLPELHYCHNCSVDLGPENGDGVCAACDLEDTDQGYYDELVRREE